MIDSQPDSQPTLGRTGAARITLIPPLSACATRCPCWAHSSL